MEEKNIKFEDLGLSENVLRALEEYGYKKPTEIQVKTIPYIALIIAQQIGILVTGAIWINNSKTNWLKWAFFLERIFLYI